MNEEKTWININEMPQEIFQGVYGDQNMNFLINAQNEYYKASEIMGKSRSSSKRYKDAAFLSDRYIIILSGEISGHGERS